MFGIKNKVNFLKAFSYFFFKILFVKECLAFNDCFGLFMKIKRVLGVAFGAHNLDDLSIRLFLYLILYQLTKFQYRTFFPSQDIKHILPLSSYSDS